jgi:integrase
VRRTWAGCVARRINAPKGNRERRVDVSQQLAKTLMAYRDRLQVEALTRGAEPAPWIFPAANGEPVIKQGFSARVWKPVLRAAGVRYRNPHVLRHTYASLLLAQGESLAYVKEQLGHASIRLTVDLYGHLVPGGNRAAVDKLDDVEAPGSQDPAQAPTFRNPRATAARESPIGGLS